MQRQTADASAPEIRDGGRTFRGAFRVKESAGWAMRLVSEEGFESPSAAQYQIRAIADRLPDVRILKPGRNRDVPKQASIPLKVEVRDDYLPRGAALVYTIAGPKRAKRNFASCWRSLRKSTTSAWACPVR